MDLRDVETAAARLSGVAHETPVLTSRTLDQLTGASCFLKCENFQRTGSFKFRGAFNAIAAMADAERARGVCTVSSGNHAQAVALSAQIHGIPAVVCMPSDAPPLKLAAVRGYGAEVRLYDRDSMPQHKAGELLAEETGLRFVSSHDDPLIAAGAGTAALELWEQSGPLDVIVAPIGGGGGISGYATVAKAQPHGVSVVGAEPSASGLAAKSVASGRLVEVPVPATIADGQRLTVLGQFNFAVIRDKVDHIVGVTDTEIVDAIRFLFERMKVVVEPSGAIALAAVLSGRAEVTGQRLGIVLSGGNLDLAKFGQILAQA